jgi:CRP-like cAMP-binding protein
VRETPRLVPPLERLLHLKRVPMLSGLTGSDLAVVADAAAERFFPRGAVVLREGEPVGSVHFVVQGALATLRRGARVGRAVPGAGVGGVALFAREPLAVQVVADEDSLTLELDADAVSEVLEDHFPILQHILREMSRRSIDLVTRFKLDPSAGAPEWVGDDAGTGDIDLVDRMFFLRRMAVFRRSSITALAELARAMAQVRFEPGTVLWREGEPAPGIFLLRGGSLRATGSSGVSFRPGPGFPLGALEALGEVPRWYEAVCETPVVALQGDRGVLVDVFEDNFGMAMDYLAVIAQATLRILDRTAARGEELPSLS